MPWFLSFLSWVHAFGLIARALWWWYLCVSFVESYLLGIKTESRNKKQGNEWKFPSGFLVLAEVRELGKGFGSQTPTCPDP